MSQNKRAVRFRTEDGGIGYTSIKSAAKDVRRGRAHWGGNGMLVYIATDRRVMAAADAARIAAAPRLWENGDGYPGLDSFHHFPVIQPIKLLTGKKPATPPRDVPATVEISVRKLPIGEWGGGAVEVLRLRQQRQMWQLRKYQEWQDREARKVA